MSRQYNEYPYDGKIFSSIRALSEYTGVNEKTITARLRRNMSVESACAPIKYSVRYYNESGEEKSIAQICKEQGKDSGLVRNRLAHNYSLQQALTMPKKIARQGKPIIVNDIKYHSIAEAIRKLDLSHKEGTIRSRLRSGWDVDAAFHFDNSE